MGIEIGIATLFAATQERISCNAGWLDLDGVNLEKSSRVEIANLVEIGVGGMGIFDVDVKQVLPRGIFSGIYLNFGTPEGIAIGVDPEGEFGEGPLHAVGYPQVVGSEEVVARAVGARDFEVDLGVVIVEIEGIGRIAIDKCRAEGGLEGDVFIAGRLIVGHAVFVDVGGFIAFEDVFKADGALRQEDKGLEVDLTTACSSVLQLNFTWRIFT